MLAFVNRCGRAVASSTFTRHPCCVRFRRPEPDPQIALRELEARLVTADARLRGLHAIENAFQSSLAIDNLEVGVERGNQTAIEYATDVVEGMLRYYVEDVRPRGLVSDRLDRLVVMRDLDRASKHS